LRIATREDAPPPRPSLRVVSSADSMVVPVISPRAVYGVIAAAIVVGALVRAGFVMAADFPLNDGGMFYAMTADLQSNGYLVPHFSTYNFDGIPFAYPPLGFYAAGLLDAATPLSLIEVLRFLPLAASILTMAAFVPLARRFLDGDQVGFAAAVVAFALTPRSFEWMIMGGGLTRSFGLLFAVLALHQAVRMYETRRPYHALATGLLAALTALSHLEMAWFFTFSTGLLLAARGRDHDGVRLTAMAAGVAITATAPWSGVMLDRHGLAPFLAATETGSPSPANPVLAFLVFKPTDEPMFAIIAAISLLGIAWCLGQRQWLLPLWLLACGLLDPRGFGNVGCVPLALLAGVGLSRVLLPALAGGTSIPANSRAWLLPAVVLGFLFLYALINAMVSTPRLLRGLNQDEREAMIWVDANTPADSRFLVVTDETWAVDRTSEWFPVLARRQSVATVQGYEWIRGAFSDQLQSYRDAQLCADRDAACVEVWLDDTGKAFEYVYVPKIAEFQQGYIEDPDECCAALRASLRADERYNVVFDGEGATVFDRRQNLRRLRAGSADIDDPVNAGASATRAEKVDP
jgi:hypothetical protein